MTPKRPGDRHAEAQPPAAPAPPRGRADRCRGAPRPDRRGGGAAPRLAAAPLAGHRRLADPGRDPLRRHRGEPETDIGTLFWAVMFSPVWILVLKLHGLYDNDHRRIRHSTLDELPPWSRPARWGPWRSTGCWRSARSARCRASAIAVGVGALLGNFASRAVLRFLWHRLAGARAGIVVGPPAAADVVARRVATHPETRLHLVGYLAPRRRRAGAGGCRGSARSPTSRGWRDEPTWSG